MNGGFGMKQISLYKYLPICQEKNDNKKKILYN